MLETLSDYLSFGVIIFFLVALCAIFFVERSKKKKARILASQEKYFREW